jgi:hypothetical protein
MNTGRELLDLPEVTLVCVDTRTPALGLVAMRLCMQQIRFGKALMFTAPEHLPTVPDDITAVPLQIDSVPAYSQFMLRGLLPHIQTSHLLIVQWDGYVLDVGAWNPDFLRCDYIGAPLRNEPPDRAVGNGGFSLRSRRLLVALQDPAMQIHHPEDTCICHANRDRLQTVHGIRFATLALAQQFSYERVLPSQPTLGFHGLFNMQRFMSAAALHSLIEAMPDSLARGLDAHDLCSSLIALQQWPTARLILNKRRRLGMNDRRTLRLWIKLAWAQWRQPTHNKSAHGPNPKNHGD